MKEEEIRPANIFEEYLRLSALDIQEYFKDSETEIISCPACGSESNNHEFIKHGFSYVTCNHCGSLFQSPRPKISAFESFYNESTSSKYWAEKFFPSVAEARREKIFIPRVEYLHEFCKSHEFFPETIVDVGAGYGIFLEEWKKKYSDIRTIAIEPSVSLAQVCREKGIEVVESIVENVTGYDECADMVVCFEVLEHFHEPLSFIETLSSLVKPGGYLMVSTLGVDGFDIQTLWEKSNSVSPPHHINFLSINGFHELFKRAGFIETEVSTPGVLDVDIVKNACRKDPTVLKDNRFIKKIIGNENLSDNFQQFLISENLSSHVWVFSRKK